MYKNELMRPSKRRSTVLALCLTVILTTACVSTPVPSGNDAVCDAWRKAISSVEAGDARLTREEAFAEYEALEEICP